MYVIKEKLKYGYILHDYTAANKINECFTLFYKSDIGKNYNDFLLKEYGGIYKIIKIVPKNYICINCECKITQSNNDLIRSITVFNKDKFKMGDIIFDNYTEVYQAIEQLQNGGCPVCDGWNDGLGNTCGRNGWGKTKFFFKDLIHISQLKN